MPTNRAKRRKVKRRQERRKKVREKSGEIREKRKSEKDN